MMSADSEDVTLVEEVSKKCTLFALAVDAQASKAKAIIFVLIWNIVVIRLLVKAVQR